MVSSEHLEITDKEIVDWLQHKVKTSGWVTLDCYDPDHLNPQTCCPYRVETDGETLEEWEESVRSVLQWAIYKERNNISI